MNKREWMLQAALAICGSGRADVNVTNLNNIYDAICAETSQEGAWVEHAGDVSTAPHVDDTTEVVFRDGSTGVGMAGNFVWDHHGEYGDIVRWRYA